MCPPQIINNRTMVPVRFVAENLGADVEWVKATREVKISFNKFMPAKEDDTTGGTDKPVVTDKPGNTYAKPRQPLFGAEDSFELLSGNLGKVTFMQDYNRIVGEHTGFRLYYTNDDGNPDIYEFTENGFSYSDLLGKTVDISVTSLNNTAESSPFKMRFAMLDKVRGDTMWSERQTDDLMGAPCWYGLSWYSVAGATSYKIFVSNSISDYLKFVNNNDLSGFSSMITSETYFSTKSSTGLPSYLVNASWAEERYVVIYPLNADGEMGLFPRHYKIPMTGISTRLAN